MSSPIFPANPTRFDPYKGYRFLLYFTTTSPTSNICRDLQLQSAIKRAKDGKTT